MIELHDGHACEGDVCWYVTPRGAVQPFALVRADLLDETGFHPIPVIVAAGSGLYGPSSCYVTERNAIEEGRRRKSARRRLAERDLAELGAELGGEG